MRGLRLRALIPFFYFMVEYVTTHEIKKWI